MKTSFKDRPLASLPLLAAYAGAIGVALVACWLPSRTTATKLNPMAMVSMSESRAAATNSISSRAAVVEPALPLQNQSSFYLHGTGPVDNPPTLFLDGTAPSSSNAKDKDSTNITRNGGNPWKEVGTWPAASSITTGTLSSLSDLHVWLGLKNSDDQGTYFDLRAEAYKNGSLITSGESRCITGVTRNATSAKEVILGFSSFAAAAFNGTSDVLSLKILTRVGTDANGASCGGHSNAVGLRLYFDATNRSARFSATMGGDTTPPALTIDQPADNLTISATQVNVSGTYSDASQTTVVVNGIPAESSGGTYSATVPLNVEGSNPIQVVATDAAGNQSTATRTVKRDTIAPTLTLNSPVAGAITRVVTVSGTATDTQPVVVTMDGVEMNVASGGAFEGTFDLPEGTWNVHVTAVDGAGNKTEILRSVTVDTTPPEIGELSPVDGTKVNSPVTVSGRVTDASPTTVKVNGGNASVNATGHFDASGVVIAEGINQISISAKDTAGNESVATFSLVGRDHTPPAAPTLFAVMTPTRLAFQTIEGKAEPGALMTITGGVELVESSAALGNGHFAANVNLKAGINTLSVVATDSEGNTSQPAQVSIFSDPNAAPPPAGQAAQINVSTGNTQKGLVNTELPRPLIAIVTDSTGTPVAGVTVKFTVKEGGGHFLGGSDTFETQTDAHGYASARYISGAAGLQEIRSDFTGNMITSAVFLAESFEAEAGAETLVSGTVLDQNLRALPNVLVRLGGQQTRTRADGIFVLREVASGPHQLLELIGRDQIPLPGRWPNITYDLDVLPGTDNQLGRPLFLPRVNEGLAMPLNEQGILTQDVVVELPVVGGEAPVTVTARAGTHVTFPPDATDKRLSVTRIAADRVPMALEDGRATNLYISVQPSGALFEPALEVSFPNLDRQPADSEVLLMSFDHDAGRYVKVGTAHVTPDGRSVKSDPGTGIRVGAWHATPPPSPKPQVTVIGQIKLDGNPAFDNKVVTRLDAWVDGVPAVLNPSLSTAPGSLQAIITLTMPDGAPRRTFVQSTAQTAQITLSPTEIFVSVGGEKEVTASVSPAPTTPGTFTWQSDDANRATVAPATGSTNPNVVKIKGVKQGKTKVTVTFVDPTNPKAKLKGEVKVNVGSVIYKEAKAKQCMGFDDTQKDASGNPLPWVVVGVSKTNTAAVADIEPDAAATHVTFASSAPSVATVAPATATRDNEPLTVTGVATGVTDIQSQFDNTNADKLNVSVKKRVPLRVTFNYVSDNAGHHTGRSHAEAQAILDRMNEIYGPQTNVEFVMGQVRDIQVQQDLGDKIDILPCPVAGAANCDVFSPDYQAIKPLGDTTADRNIFFVWRQEFNPSHRNEDVDGIAENPGTNLFIEDSLGGEIGQIASHESGHNFGLGHYIDLKELRYLMYRTTEGGCFIPKHDADIINP